MAIRCRFDSEYLVVGVVTHAVAVCLSPMIGKIGSITLEVSLDNGLTYASQATYTLGKTGCSMPGLYFCLAKCQQRLLSCLVRYGSGLASRLRLVLGLLLGLYIALELVCC